MLAGLDPANQKPTSPIGRSLKLGQCGIRTKSRKPRNPHRVTPNHFNVIMAAPGLDIDLGTGIERFEFYAVRSFGGWSHIEPPAQVHVQSTRQESQSSVYFRTDPPDAGITSSSC